MGHPPAGLSLWIDLGGINSLDFAAHAARFGVEVAPGTITSPTGANASHIRLPFGQPDALLADAARRLGHAWNDLLEQHPGKRLRHAL